MTRPDDFDALVLFAMACYEASAERAETIVINHADAVRAEMEKANAEKTKETAHNETAPPESPAE